MQAWNAGLPGGGPWKILPECPSELAHNTTRAAGGRISARGVRAPCICPRAVYLLEQDRERRRIQRREDRVMEAERKRIARAASKGPDRTAEYGVSGKVSMPDLSRGSCRTEWGRRIHDQTFEHSRGSQAHAWSLEAKAVCEGCPVIQQCREYVLAAENTVARWAGVWGGLTPKERQVERRKERQRVRAGN